MADINKQELIGISSLDYPGNPKRSTKGEEAPVKKEIKKIVSGTVTMHKKSFGQRFKETFFGEQAGQMKDYILRDVVIPTIRDTIWSAGSGALEILLFKEVRHRRRGPYGSPWRSDISRDFRDAYRSYDSYYYGPGKSSPVGKNQRPGPPQDRRPPSRGRQNVDNIEFSSRVDAKEVLDQLCELIDTDGYAGIRDLYAMLGEDTTFVDEYWGWTDLGSAVIIPFNGGYLLELPKAVPVK